MCMPKYGWNEDKRMVLMKWRDSYGSTEEKKLNYTKIYTRLSRVSHADRHLSVNYTV